MFEVVSSVGPGCPAVDTHFQQAFDFLQCEASWRARRVMHVTKQKKTAERGEAKWQAEAPAIAPNWRMRS